jgi:hypothetical protein
MNKYASRYATPFTIGLFAVSAISGVALFLHVGQGLFHEMHEILSMVLLVPFGFHVWKNWSSIVGYATRGGLLWPVVISLVLAVPFAAAALGEGGRGEGNPFFRMSALVTSAPLAQIAPVFKTSPDALIASLKGKGFKVDSADQSIDAIAKASGKPANEVLFAAVPAK